MRSTLAARPGARLQRGPESLPAAAWAAVQPTRRCARLSTFLPNFPTRALSLLLLLLFWALPGAGAPATALAAESGQLLAAVPANVPPLFSTSAVGSPEGFAVEVLRQVAERAGYSLVFLSASTPDAALRLVELGQAQVAPGFGVSQERRKLFLFTRPFETQPVHIFTRKGGAPREDQAALAGARVSVVRGSIPEERLAEDGRVVLQPADSLPQALFDLLSGDTDALVYQTTLVEHAAHSAGLEQKLARSRQPLFEISRAFAVAKDRPDVQASLENSLAAFRDTPEFQQLYSAWHKDPQRPLLTLAAWGAIIGALLLVAGVLLAWRHLSLWRMHRRLLAVLSERDQALGALRLTQERMEALLTLSSMASPDSARLVRFALEEGVRLTGSDMGYLFFVEDDSIDLAKVYWHLGGKPAPPLPERRVYPLSEAGLWADCLRTSTPVVVNSYDDSPDRRGLPAGHMPVQRFMAVPLVEAGQPVAVFGVANKAGEYDSNDVRQLQLFLVGLWRVLKAQRDAESIRQGRDYAESLIEGANVMLVGLDKEGRTTLFNAAAEASTGYARSELLGRDWCAAMLPEDQAEASAALYRDFMAGRVALPRQAESPLRTKDGQLLQISWQNSLLRQGDSVTGVIAFGIDITGQQQAEAELRQLHLAIEQAAEGVAIVDQAGIIIYANKAFERMTGQGRPGGLKGGSVFDLEVSVLDHHSSVAPGEGIEGTWRGTCAFARPGGGAGEVEFAVSATRSRGDKFLSFVAVCRDVTEKRLLEHQLWQAQKMEALGTLAGGIAHDFNNLLASIMGFTELAMDDAPAQSRGRACLDRVLAASLRARELVRQILSFSRRSEHKLRHLNADAVVAEALKLLEASLDKSIEIKATLDSRATILADLSQIHQIVMNLCTNGAQSMGGRGGRLMVRTSCGPLSAELATRHRLTPGEYFSLQVEDQGPGIAPEVLARIFEPFFTTKGPGDGTGLGLAVVHGIAMSLGGAVWAESEPDQGARFQVLLPAQSGPAEAAGDPAPEHPHGHGRILLVDDEQDLLDLGRVSLTALGYQVTVEPDPEAALRQLTSAPEAFDLLITDMNMPRLTGLQLAEELRQVRPQLPIIFITGFSRSIPQERFEALGRVQLLPKPFSTGELAQAVRLALAVRKGGEQ